MKLHFQNVNSVPTFMNSFSLVVIFVSVFAPQQARAAVCPLSTLKCQKTDFTTETCDNTSLVCACIQDYMPIPTGCARKLETPTVTLDPWRTGQFVPNATVNLTCKISEPAVSVTFEWRRDGHILQDEKSSLLSLADSNDTISGKYSCRVIDPTVNFTSDLSADQAIVVLDDSLAAGVVPVVSVSPASAAAPGVELDVRCTNIPYGATYKFKVGQTEVDVVKQNSSKQTTVTCVLKDGQGVTWGATKESAAVTLPSDTDNIAKVTISPSTSTIVKTGSPVTFTCATEPDEKFLQTAANTVNYTFQDSGVATFSGNKYNVSSGKVTTRTITCAASYANKAEIKSQPVNVTFSDSYIPAPTLNASQTVVHQGQLLVIKCVADPSIRSCVWLKDGATIPRQNDRTIQFGSFQPSDAGKYVCTVTKDSYTVSSSELDIKSNAPEHARLGSAVTVLVAVICWRLF